MAKAIWLLGGMACGFMLATAVMASHADDVSAEVSAAAREAGVDAVDLAGAVNSTGLDPYVYLRGVGELASSPAPVRPPALASLAAPAGSARIDCIIRHESQGDPNARNRSGASGLGQFLPSTWASTPQGKAGLSVFNAAANRAAIAWMLANGRALEFDAVKYFGC